MSNFWSIALSVGGLGAIGTFVFWSLYKGWLTLPIFRELTSAQTFRLMVVFLILTFVFCTIALTGFLVRNKLPTIGAVPPPFSLEALKNASYKVDGNEVTLRNGARQFGEDSFKEGYIDILLEEWAFGDLDGNGSQDAVVVLAASYGGSGTFMHLIPVLNRSGAPQPQDSDIVLGDRDEFRSIVIRDGITSVQILTQGPNDGLCCPTVLKTLNFKFQRNALVCADQDCKNYVGTYNDPRVASVYKPPR